MNKEVTPRFIRSNTVGNLGGKLPSVQRSNDKSGISIYQQQQLQQRKKPSRLSKQDPLNIYVIGDREVGKTALINR
eukprot:Pgem_evm1s15702